jgi:hypothetical protein
MLARLASPRCVSFVRRSDRNSDEAEKLSPARPGASLCQVRRDGIRGAHGLIAQSGNTSDRWYGQRFDDLEAQLLSEVPHTKFLDVLHAPAYNRRGPEPSSFERTPKHGNAQRW